MANKIARGHTGQSTVATPFEVTGEPPFGDITDSYYWVLDSHLWYYYSNHPEYQLTDGWDSTDGGQITIPLHPNFNTGRPTASSEQLLDAEVHHIAYYKYVRTLPNGDVTYLYTDFSFELACLTVEVRVSKSDTFAIPGTSPQQYRHSYTAQAIVVGGTAPFTYSWSSTNGTVTGGSGASIRIDIVDNSSTDSSISGYVECTVTGNLDCEGCGDCYDTNSAGFGGANPDTGPYPCTKDTNDPSSPAYCDTSACGCKPRRHCTQVTGNNPVTA